MRTRHRRPTVGMGLIALAALVVAVVLAILPAPAEAVTCPTNSALDADNDGFTDAQECAGISLNQGTAAAATFPSCFDTVTGARTALARSECLDPNSPDLFVILVPAAVSLIPPNFFEFVSKPKPAPDLGLGITVHQLTAAQAGTGTKDRLVTSVSTQKAVRVTENTANLASGTVLGQATNGTPITTGRVVVWPVRILEHVNAVRAVAQPPLGPLLATDPVVVTYIKQVSAHEMGHVLGPLANVDATTASANGGKHYASADHVVMSQFVTNDGLGNFQIGDDFKLGDQGFVKLK